MFYVLYSGWWTKTGTDLSARWRWSSPRPISPLPKWMQSSAATTATPTGSCPRRSSSTWFGGIQEIGKWWGSARRTPLNPFPGLLSKIEPEVILALPRILAEVVGERQGARQLPQEGEDIQKVQFKMRLGEDDSLWLTQVLNKQSWKLLAYLNSVISVNSVNSVNSVSIVNSVLPPSLMVFCFRSLISSWRGPQSIWREETPLQENQPLLRPCSTFWRDFPKSRQFLCRFLSCGV